MYIIRRADKIFLISNFRRVLNAVCFRLGNSPASEFYIATFRNTLFHLHKQVGMKYTSYSVDNKNQQDVTFCGSMCLQHIPTRGYNITQSSAPDDGHMVARNMLSNY